MGDHLTTSQRSANMSRIRSKDTKPEMTVRRLLHALGFRYRVQGNKLPGRPDLVFSARKKVVFVHGCFWHQHDDGSCRHGRQPKTNANYWSPKLRGTKLRDQQNIERLASAGWTALTIWECEVQRPENIRSRLIEFLGETRVCRR